MSVKITRHEEKRNTSLRDFLLAATLPLLLIGTIGYLLGASNAGDSQKNAVQLKEMEARAKDAEKELRALNGYISYIDSMHVQVVIKEKKALRAEFNLLKNKEDDGLTNPMADWAALLGEFNSEIENNFRRKTGNLTGEGILSSEQIDILSDLFLAHHGEIVDNFDYRLRSLQKSGVNRNDFSEELEELRDDCDDAKEELERKIRSLENDIKGLERKNESLIDKIASKAPCVTIDCPDNLTTKENLVDVLSAIQTTVDGLGVKKKMLGFNKDNIERINKFRVKLNEQLRDADKYVTRIE